MPKSVWDILLESLEDLGQDQFRRFTSKLTDSRLGIRKAAVEGKDRGEVARNLIDTFTEQGALGRTVNLLKEVGFNQTAKDLEEAAEANGYPLSPVRDGPPAEKTSPGEFSEADFIDQKYAELVERATGVEAVLDTLMSMKVINNTQYSDISSKETQHKMMRCLIRGPINSSGKSGKSALYKVLMEKQPFMMKDLGAR